MPAPPTSTTAAQVAAWAASGAMTLTGHRTSPPLGPPRGLVPKLDAVARLAAARAAELGGALDVDPLALLGERAAILGLRRHGAVSCGGVTRLLPAAGGRWLAVALARPEDEELVPAWLERDDLGLDPWDAIATAVAERPAEVLDERAGLLGLPVGLLPPPSEPAASPVPRLPIRRVAVNGPPVEAVPLAGIVVLDLSALWAGPLCGALLASAGATVIKVESMGRPDGARRGPRAFFDLLNAGKRSVALDLGRREGVGVLRDLVAGADVVVEASRPRALEHLGIDARAVLSAGRTRVWASITGHGRTGAGRDRVAFGDDAAVAGGLVSGPTDRPVFCADAAADPATGLTAAAGILDALAGGRRWLLDISMTAVAAHLAGPTLPVPHDVVALTPRARSATGRAPALGEHTAAVLAELVT